MADASKPEIPNTVTITDAGPSRKKLTIEIPRETIDAELKGAFDLASVEAEMPGFRKGRAPRRLVEKKFGLDVRNRCKGQLVAAAYSKAVEEHKLRVVSDPTSETLDAIAIEPGKALRFEVEVEVAPEFNLPDLHAIKVRKPQLQVTDEAVADALAKLAVNEGRLESLEKSEAGDYLTGHAVMKDDAGATLLELNGAVVQIPPADKKGKGMILGVVVDDFGPQMGFPKPGDSFTILASGPENHENEKVRGKKLRISFKVDRADRIVPATTQELLEKTGQADEAALRDGIRRRLEMRVATEQQTVMRQQVAQALLDATEMPLPERLTAQQAGRAFERRRLELSYQGVEASKIEENIAELRAASAQVAQRELKLFFILSRAAEVLDIKVTEGEVNNRIAQMAFERNERPEKLRQTLIQSNQVGGVFNQVREHKTMDAILSKATITELPVEEFNAQMDAESKARAKK
ncbi:MAG: trigger factor [Phycisphaerae bacterium]|nr:trigger factor [Phycisphaerae bacterium]